MEFVRNPARDRLENGELSLGVGIRYSRTAEVGKIMKTAGFDWLFLDLEHSALDLETAAQMAAVAHDAGISPIVRVPKPDIALATRMLDNGAIGIVIPHVDTAEEARLIVQQLKYPPLGHRSLSSTLPHFDFRAVSLADGAEAINARILIVVMLESPTAIENAEEIAAVPGIDVLLIGTGDLSSELGIAGQWAHERIAAAYEKVIAACKTHGKWPGMAGIYDESVMPRYIEMGARFILCGGDLSYLIAGATRRAGFVRGIGLD